VEEAIQLSTAAKKKKRKKKKKKKREDSINKTQIHNSTISETHVVVKFVVWNCSERERVDIVYFPQKNPVRPIESAEQQPNAITFTHTHTHTFTVRKQFI